MIYRLRGHVGRLMLMTALRCDSLIVFCAFRFLDEIV